jgi:RNA polymerase sigma-70 factor (ECF subfamily)
MITNLSIDHLNRARARRMSYIGPWLPEPLMKEKAADSFKSIDLYHSLSIGMMVLLEKLTSSERAVFLLREVFAYDYSEISSIVDKSEDNCRQIFNRAKKNLDGREKRFKIDVEAHEKILQQFLRAVHKGDMDGLIELLREDVVLVADGGGTSFSYGGQKFSAALNPIIGRTHVSKFMTRVFEKAETSIPGFSFEVAYVNGLASSISYSHDKPISLVCIEIVDGRISNIYVHANPDKIRNL